MRRTDHEEVGGMGDAATSHALGEAMKVEAEFLRVVLRGIVAEENQKLLLKLEDLVMSAITPMIQSIQAKVTALKASNDALNASVVEKDQQLAAAQQKLTDAQAKLDAALQNTTDPVDVQLLNDISAVLG